MKSILLASASVIAFAGAAAAEITWSADAVLGYNTDDGANGTAAQDSGSGIAANDGNGTIEAGENWFSDDDDQEGFYWELDLDVTLSQTLDNGLTVGAEFGFEVADENLGQTLDGADYVLFVESENAGLYFGDTAFAAETHWVSAGDMESDGFSEQDGEAVLRGDLTYGSVSASVSYVLNGFDFIEGGYDTDLTVDGVDADGTTDNDFDTPLPTNGDDLEQLSIGLTADLGQFNVVVAYQEAVNAANTVTRIGADGTPETIYNENGGFNINDVWGISVGTSFGGADVRLAYADNSVSNSTGLSVSYPVGPVVIGAYYVSESVGNDNWGLNVAYEDGPIAVALDYQDDQGVEKIGLEGSYDVGNGLVVYAGYLTQDSMDDRFYVAGEYDLGSGASLLVSYADDDDNVDEDEIGANDYQRGTTVEVSFEF